MKILLTTDVFPPEAGGSGQSTAALARALARRGHDVSVVFPKARPLEVCERQWHQIRVLEIGTGAPSPSSARRQKLAAFLGSLTAEERFDLAHAQHLLSADATLKAGARAGFPVVVTVRDYWPVCIWSTRLSGTTPCPGCSYRRRVVCIGRRHRWLWPLAPALPPFVGSRIGRRQNLLRRAAAVVAVSRYVALQIPFVDARVIPNLLDEEAIDTALAGSLPAGLPEHFVLFVGKLEPNKAPDRLVTILSAANVNLPLVVAGQGRLEPSLRDQSRRAGIEAHFLGWTEHAVTLRLLRHAAAVLFPSRWQEPLSRVLLEGLGVGAAMVVEPNGGTEEMIVDGETGLAGRSDVELGAALRRLVSDAELAERLRRGARRRARERFSERAVVPQLEELYRRVVVPRGPA